MLDNINEYIESGILETYVLGEASEEEAIKLLSLKKQYPQVQTALQELEENLERLAQLNAKAPPPGTWDKIEDNINGIIKSSAGAFFIEEALENRERRGRDRAESNYIDIDAKSSHMRVHKLWRLAFIIVFLLGKVFLGFAIYFYLENRQAREEVKELKQEILNKR